MVNATVLRQLAMETNDGVLRGPAMGAADEIEALNKSYAALKAENAKLREALDRANYAMWIAHYGNGIAVEYARNVHAETRAALGGRPMSELKPCPFCGCDAAYCDHMTGTIIHPAYRIRCQNCSAAICYTDTGDHVEEWNTRPTEEALRADIAELVGALKSLLNRDTINTCIHEETYRGGAIWEICNACGAKWADDEGGKPEWTDPPEWTRAFAIISKHEGTQ